MDTNNCIAQCRIGDCATVRVLSITPNEGIICNKDCACINESDDGSIQCSIHWIKKMVNFKTTALVIDYEIILESSTDWDWPIISRSFPIVNEDGIIYSGNFVCDDFISPEQIQGHADTVYPGTKGRCRFFYEDFPKEGRVVSILVNPPIGPSGRIDLTTDVRAQNDPAVELHPAPMVPQQDNNLQERVERLEAQMRKLCTEFDLLRLSLNNNNVSADNPNAPMRDPGIGYHPLGRK